MPPTNQGQNLINQSSISLPSSNGKPAGFYRSIVLDALSIISAFIFGYSYYEYLASGISPLIVIGAFLVFGVFSALQALLCNEAGRRAFIILCEVIMFGMFFYSINFYFLLGAVVCAFIMFFWGYMGSKSEIDYGIEIRPFKATKSVVGKAMTGVIIFMIVIYIPLWNQNSIFISQKSFNTFFDWCAGVVNTFYPKISLSGSFGDFVNDIARDQLQTVTSFQGLSSDKQNALVAQSATSIIDSISKDIGINIQPSDAISVTAYQFITKTFVGWENSFQGAFFVGWGVVLFFAARSVGIILVWIDQFLFFLVYEILLATRFIYIKEEPWTKEVVKYRSRGL